MNKTFPTIKGQDKIKTTAFYKWLEQEDKAGNDINKFVPTSKRYANDEHPFKGRNDGEAHKLVYNAYWRAKVKS